jgi:hypothetical protein
MDFSSPSDPSSPERGMESYFRKQILLRRGNEPSLIKLLCLFLACGIDNGLDWIIRFSERIQQSTEAKEKLLKTGTLGNARNDRLIDTAVSLLEHFGAEVRPATTNDTLTTNDAVNATTTLTTPALIIFDPASSETHMLVARLTEFPTAILDPRIGRPSGAPELLPFTLASPSTSSTLNPLDAGLSSSDADFPEEAPVSSSDCAIIDATFSSAWIAVPAALAHLTAWRKRAWVAELLDLYDESDDTTGRQRGPIPTV